MAKIAMTSDKKIMVLNEGVEGIPSITVDTELRNTSTNPVQNKVVKAAIDAVDTKVENKQNKIEVIGLLKSDGTTISVAVPGTDYAVPSTEPVVTPHIGANGNWFIGDTDTGVAATGQDGSDYVLTDADKSEIAALVLAQIPDGDEVAYG